MQDALLNRMVIDRVLEAWPDVWAIYRFGSAGTCFERTDSDIDVAILPPRLINNLDRWELAQDLARGLRRNVDLVGLLSASTVLRYQVLHYSQRIYCADPLLSDEFESRTLSDYMRLNEARQGILKDIKERGRVYAG